MPTTGRYSDDDGQPRIRFERTYRHPVDAVWSAISDPAALQQWFPTTVEWDELTPGAPIRFRFAEPDYPDMTGEVSEVRAPTRLAFTWGADELLFELAPAESGAACRLAFTVILDAAEKAARDGAGWEACLDALGRVAGGEHPQRPLPTDDWRDYYEAYQRLGFPAGAEVPETHA
jgi:uncharacterized protein YndB with AHSA1/START domain